MLNPKHKTEVTVDDQAADLKLTKSNPQNPFLFNWYVGVLAPRY